jgi:hypothetical protein
MTRVKRIAASDGSLVANQTVVDTGNDSTTDLHAKAGHIIRTAMKCFNCLGAHSYRHCKLAKAKCSKCNFAHHTDMHDVVQELNERASKRTARAGPSPAEIDAARAVGMKAPTKAYRTDLSSSVWEATVAGYEEYAGFHSDNPPEIEDPRDDTGSYSAMMSRLAALEVDQDEPLNIHAYMGKFGRHRYEPTEEEWEI